MKHEYFKFEVTLHFEGENGYEKSINDLRKEMIRVLNRVDETTDVEIDLIERKATEC